MESVIRALIVYVFLMLIVRLSGKRTLTEMTVFDFILLLVIGDASQQAITSNDYSITNAIIVITTFVVVDIFLSYVKRRFKTLESIIDGTPLIILSEGKVLQDQMKKARIDISDILESARKSHGLMKLDEIRYAILEKDGGISIIPQKSNS